jgi:hypothetical protein
MSISQFSGIWTRAVLLGTEEVETIHITPSHAAGLQLWVRPAVRDLLIPRTIEKWDLLF